MTIETTGCGNYRSLLLLGMRRTAPEFHSAASVYFDEPESVSVRALRSAIPRSSTVSCRQ
jgi:hypothetical protein